MWHNFWSIGDWYKRESTMLCEDHGPPPAAEMRLPPRCSCIRLTSKERMQFLRRYKIWRCAGVWHQSTICLRCENTGNKKNAFSGLRTAQEQLLIAVQDGVPAANLVATSGASSNKLRPAPRPELCPYPSRWQRRALFPTGSCQPQLWWPTPAWT